MVYRLSSKQLSQILAEHHPVSRGAINNIYSVEIDGRHCCLRVRARPEIFAYEHDMLKEPVLLHFWQAIGDEIDAEAALDLALLNRTSSLPNLQNSIMPTLHVADETKQAIEHLYTISDWVEGQGLARANELNNYRQAGTYLARLHDVSFKRFRNRFNEPWLEAPAWKDTMLASLKLVPNVDMAKVEAAADYLEEVPSSFTLVHNDFHPMNLIVGEQGLSVVDWDNAVISVPEMDLVKMKYWTCAGDDGVFKPCAERYNAFLNAYRDSGGFCDAKRLRFCEIIWLLRIIAFDGTRKAQGANLFPFPDPQIYVEALGALMAQEAA
ncbi:aminoglycoside phosphotransferase family protein [Rhodobacteraceae bacterium RKSG542]|uniref:phosphotransferase family protein n=1 Tax=Pseudovibrio flavus TaxID=2529854 RepID=UPI0012BD0C08|nr:aminoglycoside phosphotransferase family protein [Pseudovibrio flavus]MTI18785.1 aminoglycoside phosphotransferase family protein [Pseudovibrio flavus]